MASRRAGEGGFAEGGGGGSGAAASASSTKDLLTNALQARVASNNYIAHLKVWETVNEGPGGTPQRKARYLILAVQRDSGRVTVNKAKRNANGTFSIGKDWDLNQLREIIVEQQDVFTLTLSRSYSWQTERARDQTLFLQSVVKVYRKYTGEDGPHVVGLEVSAPTANGSSHERPSEDKRSLPRIDTAVAPDAARGDTPASSSSQRRPHDGFYDAVSRQGASVSPTAREAEAMQIPTISTTFAGKEDGSTSNTLQRPRRRPTLDRQQSAMAVMTPTADVHVDRQASLSAAQSPIPQSISQGNSPAQGTTGLPRFESPPSAGAEEPVKLSRNPSRVAAKLAAVMDRAATPTRRDNTNLIERDMADTDTNTSTSLAPPAPAPRRPQQNRTRTSESLSSSLSAPGGGDARARLSSIEPTRGGAAYEKMLLAGTGLTGVAEGDDDEDEGGEDEDPYGGAEFGETHESNDLLSHQTSAKHKRRSHRINEKDVQDTNKTIKADILPEDDEDNILMHVEEMLEGFEFKHNANGLIVAGRKNDAVAGKGTADIIEARLLDELAALDAANIHAIIESDDRVNFVVQHMEQALHELDVIDSMIAGYKMQLNARAEDIHHIESQNRGLQVQTSNQRALSAEIEKLLDTVHVDDHAVGALLHTDLQTDEDIGMLEAAGAALYKAMLQARRTQEDSRGGDPSAVGMAAATERLEEYAALADRFAKRLLDFLTQTFNEQVQYLRNDKQRAAALSPPSPTLLDHSAVEAILGRYCGLLLYAKEVSPTYFSRISAAYFASASERYKADMSKLFSVCKGQIARTTDEEISEASFIPPSASSSAAALRSGTIRRPNKDRANRGPRLAPGEMLGSEAFTRILTAITPIVTREQVFIADLLHINSNAVTFADYMDLEAYFRRRAAAVFGSGSNSTGAIKNMKDALDLVFGFLAPEWQGLIDHVIGRDKTQIVGILAALDRGMLEAEEVNNEFLLRSLSKLQTRLASQMERHIADQVRGIEQTKLTAKKRKGVVHFIKAFPLFVDRIEAQLINAETLQIRSVMDHYYEQICSTMFDALQTMAIPKMEGGTFSTSNTDEDKGQLNHHVILIENMFHIVKGIQRIQTTRATNALGPQLKRAQGILEDALGAYVQNILRRPLGKMMDFGDGIDGLLRTTPANEVSLHTAYSKQAAKRLIKEYSAKDLRKSVEALSRRVQKHFDEDEITTLIAHELGISASNSGGGGGKDALGVSGGGGLSGGVGGSGSNVYDASGVSADEIIEVLSTVWRHVEDGFTQECERWTRILRECYSTQEGKMLADFTMEDVRRPFASNSPAGRRR